MKQEIPWNRLAVEAIVIVGSILLAFAIDAGWQTRNERIDELNALQSLLSEFEANQQVIDSSIEAHGRHIASAERIRGMSFGTTSIPENYREEIRTAFFSYRSTNYEGGTLSSILSSGEISLIQNPELRRRISAWPSILEEATEEEQIVVRYREQVLLPFIIRRLPKVPGGDERALTQGNQTDEGLAQFQALMGDDELEVIMAISSGLRQGSQEALALARGYLEELIEMIAAEEKK